MSMSMSMSHMSHVMSYCHTMSLFIIYCIIVSTFQRTEVPRYCRATEMEELKLCGLVQFCFLLHFVISQPAKDKENYEDSKDF